MATYLLIHGAWFGSWCWKRVSPILRAAGHEVYSPSLTGLGERTHLLNSDTSLDTHVQDVLNVIYYEELNNIILVGHSYGAMVISMVAERVPERLQRLVYVDAFVPTDGQAMVDFFPQETVTRFKERAASEGKGYGIPSSPPEMFGITDPVDLTWAVPRMSMQPLKSFLEPVRLTNPAVRNIPHTYIYCVHPRSMVEQVAKGIRADKSWQYAEITSGHAAMILEPQKLAEVLQSVYTG